MVVFVGCGCAVSVAAAVVVVAVVVAASVVVLIVASLLDECVPCIICAVLFGLTNLSHFAVLSIATGSHSNF